MFMMNPTCLGWMQNPKIVPHLVHGSLHHPRRDLFQNMQSWVFCNCLWNDGTEVFWSKSYALVYTTYISIMHSILLIQTGIIMHGGPLLSYPSTLISTWLGGSKQTCLSGSALCIQKHINYQHSMRGFTLPIPTPIPSGRSEMFQQAVWGGFQDSWIRPWVSHHQQPDSSPPPTPLQQILAVSLVSLCLLLNSEAVQSESLWFKIDTLIWVHDEGVNPQVV